MWNRSRNLNKICLGIILILTVSIIGAVAHPVPYAKGDLFIPDNTNIAIKQYSHTGVLKNTIVNKGDFICPISGLDFSNSGNLFVVTQMECRENYDDGLVAQFDKVGNYIGQFNGKNGAVSGQFFNIVIDNRQNMYLGTDPNFESGLDGMLGVDKKGNPLKGSPFSIRAYGIDLASDQCTLLYTVDEKVKRFNVCTNKSVSDFNSHLPGTYNGDLRILSTGGVLVANGDRIVVLDKTGKLIKTYNAPKDLNGKFLIGLALDPDGKHFWTKSSGEIEVNGSRVYEYDFSNTKGPIFELKDSFSGILDTGLAIFGEPKASRQKIK